MPMPFDAVDEGAGVDVEQRQRQHVQVADAAQFARDNEARVARPGQAERLSGPWIAC
jgi:hypothetical protein